MKRIVIGMAVLLGAASVWAGPHGCGPCGPCHPCGPGWGPHPCGPGWGPRPWGPGWGPGWHHRDWWGRGGCNFWPGFIGGVVGGLACNVWSSPRYYSPAPVVVTQPVVTQPVVVQQPVVVRQPVVVQQPVVQTVVAQPAYRTDNVWVEGRYVDTVQANGSVVRVWNPGHYEQRLVP